MKDIVFLLDEKADGRNTQEIGRLAPDGEWTGEIALKKEVREHIRVHNFDIRNADDRKALMRSFSGIYVTVVEREAAGVPEK
jgi:hypothetical protein